MDTQTDNTIRTAEDVVPPMTHPLSAHWRQPERRGILMDDHSALMSAADFHLLHEYSSTNPSGVYDGKMWKRKHGVRDEAGKLVAHTWRLAWYSPDPTDPNMVLVLTRQLFVV